MSGLLTEQGGAGSANLGDGRSVTADDEAAGVLLAGGRQQLLDLRPVTAASTSSNSAARPPGFSERTPYRGGGRSRVP